MASNYRGLHQSEEGAHELPHLSSSADPYASVPNSPGLQSPDLAREGATNSTLNLNGGSATPLSGSSMEKGGGRGFNPAQSPGAWSKRKKWIVGGTAALIAIIIAAVVGGVVGSKNSDNKDSDSGNRDGHQNAVDPGDDDTDSDGVGRDGAKVTMEDGNTFIYNNSYGGYFVNKPFNNSARVREDVKALDEEWDFSTDLIQGVNLGGWLVIEPFIVPSLFEPYDGEVGDEYELSLRLGDDMADTIEEHYKTFITEQDIAEIAGAGLNWIRLPLPFWAIETIEGEPYLEGVAWNYFLKAIEWCRKYGIRIELDLHTVPGSQNGLNHSGKLGTVNWMHGVMGIVNAQRTLNYVRTLTQFISQPEYVNIIPIFMPVNEPMGYTTGVPELESFYNEVYRNIREITGIGKGKGPLISFHDGFIGMGEWNGFMAGADRIGIESHPYLAFATQYFDESTYRQQITRPCEWWAPQFNTSMQTTGLSWTGEFCLAMNDCGQYINEVGKGAAYDGTLDGPDGNATVHGDCTPFLDYPNYTDDFKNEMKMAALSYMDMSRNWLFWTWKVGANSTGLVPNPQWSYQLGLHEGWMPTDYSAISGACAYQAEELGTEPPETVDWTPPLSAWMTGGEGAGTITAETSEYEWPPASMKNIQTVSNLPTLTPTGTPITLSVPSSISGAHYTGSYVHDGWNNASYTASYYATPAGCSYPGPYDGVDADEPTAPCTGSPAAADRRRMLREAKPTPAPVPKF